jgi:hypothetical protein
MAARKNTQKTTIYVNQTMFKRAQRNLFVEVYEDDDDEREKKKIIEQKEKEAEKGERERERQSRKN